MITEMIWVPISKLTQDHPYIEDFLLSVGLKDFNAGLSMGSIAEGLTEEWLEDRGMDREQLLRHFIVFMDKMEQLRLKPESRAKEITILGGHDKSGNEENISLTVRPGDILCIVGPTGSGKSRLLADIECLAQRDTPTGRQVLVNGEAPAADKRFSIEYKLVAQLSQNMNFVMDLTVEEFVTMHAESRMIENMDESVKAIVDCANELAGERFAPCVPITQLSGGQSRALMIADTALLSASPVVLIDEIENAGVDRKKALELLVKKEKIILMSTHDPILALMGHRRIVIKNGGIHKIIETGEAEKANMDILHKIDTKMLNLRNILRAGGTVDFDVQGYFTG